MLNHDEAPVPSKLYLTEGSESVKRRKKEISVPDPTGVDVSLAAYFADMKNMGSCCCGCGLEPGHDEEVDGKYRVKVED